MPQVLDERPIHMHMASAELYCTFACGLCHGSLRIRRAVLSEADPFHDPPVSSSCSVATGSQGNGAKVDLCGKATLSWYSFCHFFTIVPSP